MIGQLRYKCIKVPLKNILKNPSDIVIIENAVQRTHQILIKTYQLVRLWALNQVNSNSWNGIGIVHFKTAFRVIKNNSRKSKSDQTDLLFNQFSTLFNVLFTQDDKVDAKNITNILVKIRVVIRTNGR